jgi:hypothetical protein
MPPPLPPPVPPPPVPPLPSHFLTAGIFGVYCSSCNQGVKKKGNGLFIPDSETIRRHFKSCRCYNGAKPPNAVNTERELIRSQDAIQAAAKNNHQIAEQKIALVFSPGTEYKAYVCNKCGYSSKRMDVFRKHFGKSNPYECQQATDASSGKVDVCKGKYDITCPKHFLTAVIDGNFSRPTKRPRNNQIPNRHALPNNNSPSLQQQPQQQQPPSNTLPLPSTQFQPILVTSPSTLTRAKEGTPMQQQKINDEARINNALSCFIDQSSTNSGDSSNVAFVKKHLPLVTRAIDAMDGTVRPELIFRKLVSMTSTTQLQDDDGALKVIKLAGNQWLKIVANGDVRRISPGFRGRLFQVGESEGPDAETMVRGKTFVASTNVDKIVTVWNHFIHFICRHNQALIHDQLVEALDIYRSKMELHEKEKDALADAAGEIVGTNIIFGIILAAVHEQPPTTNGMNSLDYFLVASSILAPPNNSLKFQAGGGIGEFVKCNSLSCHSSNLELIF